MQRELAYLFASIMPVLLVSTGIYVCFSLAVCAVSNCSSFVDRVFASKTAKSLPFVLITLIVALFR